MNKHKLCQFIIKKYVKDNINWPREVKIAQKLIKKINSYKFWKNLQDLKSKPPSLAWFLKPEGKDFLYKEYGKFKLVFETRDLQVGYNKIGEDKKVCQKPKTLLQFIKYGKKT